MAGARISGSQPTKRTHINSFLSTSHSSFFLARLVFGHGTFAVARRGPPFFHKGPGRAPRTPGWPPPEPLGLYDARLRAGETAPGDAAAPASRGPPCSTDTLGSPTDSEVRGRTHITHHSLEGRPPLPLASEASATSLTECWRATNLSSCSAWLRGTNVSSVRSAARGTAHKKCSSRGIATASAPAKSHHSSSHP